MIFPLTSWPLIIMKGHSKWYMLWNKYRKSYLAIQFISWSWNLEDLEKDKSRSSMGSISLNVAFIDKVYVKHVWIRPFHLPHDLN